jgi:NitT/TauT family transport system substrate-binding protein
MHFARVMTAFRLGALLFAITLCAIPRQTWARDKLVVGFPSLSMSTILPHVAQDLGYFDKEDLDVTVQHFESGSINAKALLSRADDLSDVETSAVLAAVANGADLRIFGTHEWGLHFVFYATRDIKSLKDLYGKRFAISGIGGLPHVVVIALLRGENLDPNKVEMLVVGGQGARLKALMAEKVDATVGEESPVVDADPKLHNLFVVEDKLPKYLSQVMAAYPDTLTSKGVAIAKFQRALIKAARFAYANKAEFVKIASKHLPGGEQQLGKVYDFYARVRHWSINGDVPFDRIEYMQQLGLETKTQSQPVDLKKLVDTKSVDHVLAEVGRTKFP